MKKHFAGVDRKENLRGVTTRDHIAPMKTKKAATFRDEVEHTPSAVVREFTPMPGVGASISVRAAKAHLSGLLDEVAAGREVVITSDGVPKARLVPMDREPERKPFTGTREHLKRMPPWRGGPTAEEIIREDRDARGW